MGKESKKEWICITDSFYCTPETNTTLKINYTPGFKKNVSQPGLFLTW